jgi:hypothetical protein
MRLDSPPARMTALKFIFEEKEPDLQKKRPNVPFQEIGGYIAGNGELARLQLVEITASLLCGHLVSDVQ